MGQEEVYKSESARERSYSKEGILHETLALDNVGGKNVLIWIG